MPRKSKATTATTVEIVDEQKILRVPRARVRRLVGRVLRGERCKKSVTVLFTDDKRIRGYHKVYMGLDSATDVMAFGAGDKDYLGDVIVSAQTAKSRAAEFGATPTGELERYAVHGVLHLLGYKDKKPVDHKRMHARQEQYLKDFTN